MLPLYVVGCTACDGHVREGLNRFARKFSAVEVYLLQTFATMSSTEASTAGGFKRFSI